MFAEIVLMTSKKRQFNLKTKLYGAIMIFIKSLYDLVFLGRNDFEIGYHSYG